MKCCNCKNLGKLKDEDGNPYDWCDEVCDCPDTQMERDCKHFTKASRADRIRAMSDEELAEFEADNCGCPVNKCPHTDDEKDCGDCWLDWLKQEVTE